MDFQDIDYEMLSYGKFGYKRIRRLRKKAKRKGIEVPQLGYELTKPDRPRITFIIVAVVSLIIFVGMLVGAGFLIKSLIDLFLLQFEDGVGFFEILFDPDVLAGTGGLSAIPAILIISAYLLLIFIVILPILFAIYCWHFAREMIYLSKCSKEEFAKGSIVSDRIFRIVVVLAVATVILITLLITWKEQTTAVVLIYVGAVLVFGAFLALLIIEKSKCAKWFDTIDEFKKENYLAHEKGLRAIKRRIKSDRQMWSNLFG